MAVMAPVRTSWERMFDAVEKTKERLARAVGALESAGIPYAVIGGNAVANWIIRIDPGAERFTKDVDLLVRSGDLQAVIHALESVGFKYSHNWGVHAFSDGDTNRISDGVHLLFENEKVKPNSFTPTPFVEESEQSDDFRVISLEALVRMKLESNRDRDRAHIRDLIAVGYIDHSWLPRFHPILSDRLRVILETPEG